MKIMMNISLTVSDFFRLGLIKIGSSFRRKVNDALFMVISVNQSQSEIYSH